MNIWLMNFFRSFQAFTYFNLDISNETSNQSRLVYKYIVTKIKCHFNSYFTFKGSHIESLQLQLYVAKYQEILSNFFKHLELHVSSISTRYNQGKVKIFNTNYVLVWSDLIGEYNLQAIRLGFVRVDLIMVSILQEYFAAAMK